jgi:hypothetical protein
MEANQEDTEHHREEDMEEDMGVAVATAEANRADIDHPLEVRHKIR